MKSSLRREKKYVDEYVKTLKQYIVTTRYNNATWEKNKSFRQTKKMAAIYCSPVPVAKSIPFDALLFVIEMNNEENTIMGIGLVKNHPYCKTFTVHENQNYNRYCYIGNHYISRQEMTESEESIMIALDIMCFSGAKHMKRGNGLAMFPAILLYRCCAVLDFIDFFKEMFRKRRIESKIST